MPASLKAEFIYFREKSDPILEFGFGGDCPMRILSSFCEDMKGYLHALKKAVSRSHITVVVGGFGENGEIAEITGLAVGREPVSYDYARLGYGNIADAPSRLPKMSLPLIDKERKFAGILMESGPQAIILLDERNRNRAYLVRELLNPYISELFSSTTDRKDQ